VAWLVYRWREVEPPYRPRLRAIDLDASPSPTVTAGGIGGASYANVWLAAEPPAGAIVTRSADARGVALDKPPYAITPLAEVAELPWNGLNVVSTFAGCGGSSTGYRMAGYRVLAAVEFVPAAQESYALNCSPRTTLVRKDVRDVEAAELLEAVGLEVGELDVLDGSPPCEPFSTAGKRDKSGRQVVEYSGQRQRTDDLFFEYARLVDGLRPRCFVAENVEGLVRRRAKGYFLWILARLRDLGYRVQARVLNASWLGVPQNRRRVIFVGVREDLERDPVFPAPWSFQYTVRDALPHIARMRNGGLKQWGSADAAGAVRRRERGGLSETTRFGGRLEAVAYDAEALTEGESGPSGDVVGFYRDTGGAKQAREFVGLRDVQLGVADALHRLQVQLHLARPGHVRRSRPPSAGRRGGRDGRAGLGADGSKPAVA
jgi:site-specific DNA-cytosine methylase